MASTFTNTEFRHIRNTSSQQLRGRLEWCRNQRPDLLLSLQQQYQQMAQQNAMYQNQQDQAFWANLAQIIAQAAFQ